MDDWHSEDDVDASNATKEENQRELIKRASLAGPQALKQEDSPLCNTT